MKRFLLTITLCVLVFVGIGTFAQNKIPHPEIYVGIGEMIHNSNGDAMKFSATFSTNFNVGARAYILPKLSLSLSYTRDTLLLGNNRATGNFGYYSYNLAIEYWVLKDV